jgi:signal peptidase I
MYATVCPVAGHSADITPQTDLPSDYNRKDMRGIMLEESKSTDMQGPGASADKEQKKIVLRFVLKLGLVVLILFIIFTFVFGIRQVSGETMYPRLLDGDLTLYYRLQGSYQIGDVVTFRVDGVKCWGRVVAQGGDVVKLNGIGQLLVNGNVQQEEVFYYSEPQDGGVTYPYTVSDDSYFIMCDYRTVGTDSRTFGAVSKNNIDGKVITILRRRGI